MAGYNPFGGGFMSPLDLMSVGGGSGGGDYWSQALAGPGSPGQGSGTNNFGGEQWMIQLQQLLKGLRGLRGGAGGGSGAGAIGTVPAAPQPPIVDPNNPGIPTIDPLTGRVKSGRSQRPVGGNKSILPVLGNPAQGPAGPAAGGGGGSTGGGMAMQPMGDLLSRNRLRTAFGPGANTA
jgi:hypothetical protein